MKFTHSAHIMPRPKPPESNRPAMWGMLTAGLAIGFMGMYFSVTRPMSQRMQMVESNLSLIQAEMHQLVGTRDDIWKTNDLLTGLRQQQRQLVEAEQALVAIREMKNEIVSLTDNHEMAMQTIQKVEMMQTALIESQSQIPKSEAAIAQMDELQKSVVKVGSSAQSQQSNIIAASQVMDKMEKMTSRIVKQKETIAVADAVVDSVDTLSSSLVQQKEMLTESGTIVTQIATLQNDLGKQGEKMAASQATVQQMKELESTLANSDQKAAMVASQNLKQMMNFQDELSTSGQRISSAIQTIELLEGFQTEIATQTGLLSKMRRDLMEISFLESTVNQTLQVLKPLIQLSDLRRMSDSEVREAARVILDRRIADSRSHDRLGPTKSAIRKIESPKLSTENAPSEKEQIVPTPTDLE